MRALAIFALALFVPALAFAQGEEEETPASEEAETEPTEAEPTEAEVETTEAESEAPEGEAEPQAPEVEEPPSVRDPHAGHLDPCATNLRSRPIGPLNVGDLDGGLGIPYRACPRNEVAIGGDALIVADADDFYGRIQASGRVRVSTLLDPNVEGFVVWEPFRWHRIISSVSADYAGLGFLSWGATARVYENEGRVYAVTGRLVLPTTTGLHQSSQPIALDVGLSGAWQASANFRFHMWVTLLGSVGIGAGPAIPRAGLRLGGGVDWIPLEWLSFVLELQNGFGYNDALDLIAAQVGIRLALGTEVGAEIAASLPFLGVRAFDDGALPMALSLTINWHLR